MRELLNPILTGICGVTLAGYGADLRGRAVATWRWSPVRGRIVRSMVRKETPLLRRPDDPPAMYRPEIRFEYVVDGREYASTRITLLDRADSWGGYAEEAVTRYPEGSEVTVYYDPADPRQAVLEREAASRWSIAFIVAGIAMALGAVLWAYFGTFDGATD